MEKMHQLKSKRRSWQERTVSRVLGQRVEGLFGSTHCFIVCPNVVNEELGANRSQDGLVEPGRDRRCQVELLLPLRLVSGVCTFQIDHNHPFVTNFTIFTRKLLIGVELR